MSKEELSSFIPVVTRPDGSRRIMWEIKVTKSIANGMMRRQAKVPYPSHYNFVSERQAKRLERIK